MTLLLHRFRSALVLPGLVSALALESGCAATSGPSMQAAARRQKAASFSPAEQSAMVQLAYAVFDAQVGLGGDPAPFEQALCETRFGYDTVFVTAYNHEGRLMGSQGSGQKPSTPCRLAADIRRATVKTVHDERFAAPSTKGQFKEFRIVLSVFYNKRPVKRNTLETFERTIEPGIHAIEIRRGKKRAVFKESVPITSNYSLAQTLRRLSRKAGLKKRAYLDPRTRVSIFDTVALTGDRQGRVTELYRVNVLLQPEALTQALVRARILLASEWFRNNVNPKTGLLEYQYDPARDAYAKDDNHIRRLASLWAIAKLANFSGDRGNYRALIKTTIEHYLALTESDGAGGVLLNIDGKASIANGAFMILAMSEFDESPNRNTLIRQLAQGIVNQQNENGAYRTMFWEPGTTKGVDYYTGEAMLGLMEAYRVLREPAYLASVERAFPHYRRYWRTHRNTAFVPWHAQVNLRLYEETGQKRYADFTFEMIDWLIDNYQIVKPAYPDELGGFAKGRLGKPRNSTSSYLEGVGAAYRLATLAGDRRHVEKYARAIRLGARFILQTQITDANSFYLKHPQRAVGGFTQTLTRTFQRNDYTQHAVMALIRAHENDLFP